MEKVVSQVQEKIVDKGVNEKSVEYFISEVFTVAIEAFQLNEKEYEKLLTNEVARFIVALPFVAGCENAQEKALAHLKIYATGVKCDTYPIESCTSCDTSTVYEDLGMLSSFEGGNEKIVQHGMTILSLVMLEAYKDRTFSDIEKGTYNPLNDGTWDYYALKASLLEEIKESPYPKLDDLILTKTGLLKNHF